MPHAQLAGSLKWRRTAVILPRTAADRRHSPADGGGPPSWLGSRASPASDAIHVRSGMGQRTWIPAADGHDERLGDRKDEYAKQRLRHTQTQAHQDDSGAIAMRLEGSQHLRPHGDHAEKEGDRSQCGGFLNNGTEHAVLHILPGTDREHSSSFVLLSSRFDFGLTLTSRLTFEQFQKAAKKPMFVGLGSRGAGGTHGYF
jgi:hypothetical protein